MSPTGEPPHDGNHCLKGYFEKAPANDQWAPAELFECRERKDALGKPPYHQGPTLVYTKTGNANMAEMRGVMHPPSSAGRTITDTDLTTSHDSGYAAGKEMGYNEGYLAYQQEAQEMQEQAQAQAQAQNVQHAHMGQHQQGLAAGTFSMGGGGGGNFFAPVDSYYGHQ